MHISLRELILIVGVCALGIASLRSGGALASVTISAIAILVMALGIVAFVGIGEQKAYAIGFMMPVLVYAATVLASGANEFDPYEGRLPTTVVLGYAHSKLVTKTWFDYMTGKVVADYDPASTQNSGGGGGFGGPSVGLTETPDRATFMSLGHILFALALGWSGGKFAVWVHRSQRPLGDGR